MMEPQVNKRAIRQHLKQIRAQLPLSRRVESHHRLLNQLIPGTSSYKTILSFASFGHEINTAELNLFLASTKRLFLPRVVDNELRIFAISSPKTQLIPTSYGLYEPDPEKAFEVAPDIIEAVIVPALGFDAHNNRLGYGKGIYDRFLAKMPCTQTIGIGYREQFVQELPIESTDIPLKKIALF